MTATTTPSAEPLRGEVRDWLKENWIGLPKSTDPWTSSPERIAWLEKVVDTGYAVPSFPVEWFGRGYPHELSVVIEQEFTAVKAPGARQDKYSIPANTVLTFGNDHLKRLLLRDFLTEQARTCLLYSEPGAGSDLAGVQTTAVREGEQWVINGQKVWTSGAQSADYALLIARTDWDVPKHKGLSFFIIPMKQSGIEVRPLVQITGESHFNAVFITDATVPDSHLVGGTGNGWRVLQTALAYERSIMGDSGRASRNRTRADNLIDLAREHGGLDDPVIRQTLAKTLATRELNALNNARAKAAAGHGTSSSIMSLGKLAMSEFCTPRPSLRPRSSGLRHC